jgi:signal transduction histidine kinase
MHTPGAWKSWRTRGAIAAVTWAASIMPGLAADPAPAAALAAGEPLRSNAAILALHPAEIDAQPKAVVRGVVTSSRVGALAIQDGDSPITVAGFGRVEADDGSSPTIERGMIVEIEGHVVAAGFSPAIAGRRTRIVGRGPVPPPVPVAPGRLARGGDMSRWVTAQGVVRGISERATGLDHAVPMLILDVGDQPLTVTWLVTDPQFEPQRLIDAEVRVTGLASALRNSRGQLVTPTITVDDPEDVKILTPPPADPFAGEIAPLDALGRFVGEQRSAHRIRTEGVVSYAAPGLIFLQDPHAAVRIDLATAVEPPLAPGDRVQVAGFLDMGRSIAGLSFAVARRVGSGPAPEPEPLAVAEIARVADAFRKQTWITEPGSYDGRLVRCKGVVEALEKTPAGLTATLSSAGGQWFATLAQGPSAAALPQLAVGSTVAVAGILRLDLDAARINGLIVDHPTMSRITLLARDAADIEVVRAAPWWTPRRLGVAVLSLAGAAAALAAWSVTLGREVRRQTGRAVAEATARQRAKDEYDVAIRERSRIAANLHDTLLQSLAGAVLQLDVCRRSLAGSRVTEAGDQLDVAKRMVKHAAADLRSSVWALRTALAAGRSFTQSLRELVDHLNVERGDQKQPERVRLQFTGAAFPLPRFVAGNLLLVVQEAVRNALHHAEATAIDVAVRFDAVGREVEVRVRDDGRGFEWGRQRGAAQGHFGLQGMQERVEALRGRLTIDTAPGRGTTVTARVTAPPHDASAEDHEAGADRADADGAVPVTG